MDQNAYNVLCKNVCPAIMGVSLMALSYVCSTNGSAAAIKPKIACRVTTALCTL